MDKWLVSIPYEDVEKMRADRAKAEAEANAAKAELAALKLNGGGGSSVAAELVMGMRAALAVIQWAQGNYDPETVRGWPYFELQVVASVVKAMPSVTEHEKEWASDAPYFAEMAEAVERARKAGRQKELGQIARAAIGTGGYAHQVTAILSQPPPQQEEPGGGGEPPSEPPPSEPPPAAA